MFDMGHEVLQYQIVLVDKGHFCCVWDFMSLIIFIFCTHLIMPLIFSCNALLNYLSIHDTAKPIKIASNAQDYRNEMSVVPHGMFTVMVS